jgi:hypothetical protein
MECSTLAYSNKLRFNVPLAYPGTPSEGNNLRGKLRQRLEKPAPPAPARDYTMMAVRDK